MLLLLPPTSFEENVEERLSIFGTTAEFVVVGGDGAAENDPFKVAPSDMNG